MEDRSTVATTNTTSYKGEERIDKLGESELLLSHTILLRLPSSSRRLEQRISMSFWSKIQIIVAR
jgi:hypothetical protein